MRKEMDEIIEGKPYPVASGYGWRVRIAGVWYDCNKDGKPYRRD